MFNFAAVMMEKPSGQTGYTGKQIAILDVAERLFAENGFDGTSVRDIAQDAGVNVAMISYYFGSKERLLHAVFVHRISAGRLLMEHLLSDKEMHPMQKMEAIVEAWVDRMMQHKAFHRMMLHSQLAASNEEVSGLIAETKRKNLDLLSRLIADGQRKKVFTKGVDANMLLLTVTGTVYQAAAGAAFLKTIFADESATEEEVSEIIKKKLKTHLKRVIKATLTYEGK